MARTQVEADKEPTQIDSNRAGLVHQRWLSRNRLLAANGAFTIYATALAVDTGQADRAWAIWAAAALAALGLFVWLRRTETLTTWRRALEERISQIR